MVAKAKSGTFVSEWPAPWLADKDLARSPKGIGGQTFTVPSRLADETIDEYLGPLVASPARTNAYALALEENALAGIEPALRRCPAPVRVLWGTGDDIFSPASPEYIARTFPRARGVRRLEGAKLFFPEEFPDVVAEEARALWSAAG